MEPVDGDAVDDRMAAEFAQWVARRPPTGLPAPVFEITPVVDDRWLTYTQAAQETGNSRRTIQQWIADGKLDTRRTVTGGVRIRAGSLWQSESRRVR